MVGFSGETEVMGESASLESKVVEELDVTLSAFSILRVRLQPCEILTNHLPGAMAEPHRPSSTLRKAL